MLDPQRLRRDIEDVAEQLRRRYYEIDISRFSELEEARKELQSKQQELQSHRNRSSKEIGRLKSTGDNPAEILNAMQQLSQDLDATQQRLMVIQADLSTLLQEVPNIPHASVPEGQTEQDNIEVRRWGGLPKFDFETRDHVELGAKLGMMDFDIATRMSGSRFVTLSGPLARLQRALTQFMLDLHATEHGYVEAYVPFLVNADALFGTGQLPKFEEDQFSTETDPKLFLIPTAEVPVTNLYREQIISEEKLPIRRVCHTPCFRREAGSYGKDTRGMIRQHQFEKVELVHVVHPAESWSTLEVLTQHAETVLQRLGLPYRVVTLCTGDLGFSSAKTYDLEVWLPGQHSYREISSCSNFEAFQARRLRTRWRNPETGKTEFVHTLNGSGLAVGRTLVAVMENFQHSNGSITVPKVLRPYLGGTELITRDSIEHDLMK
jgi:seryl-tRNA synthetase